ncbi:hypothetical protein ACFLRB_00030 [Acidobacteriota bacterium]
MKRKIASPAILILILSVIFLVYCGGKSLRVNSGFGGISVSGEDSSDDSSKGSGASSQESLSQATSDDSSDGTSGGTSYTTSKPKEEQNNRDREILAAIFDESATTNGARPQMAILAHKHGLSEADVFETISKLTAEGKISSEKSLQSNSHAKAALILIEGELKQKADTPKK